jgi:hypothetical protein
MSNYAKIENGIVTNVIICEDSQISSQSGHHIKETDLTKKACLGHSYDVDNNKFIAPKPFESWILNENFDWVSPIGESPAGLHEWNEETQEWVEVIIS